MNDDVKKMMDARAQQDARQQLTHHRRRTEAHRDAAKDPGQQQQILPIA